MAFDPRDLPQKIREVFHHFAMVLTGESPHAVYNEARAHLRDEFQKAGWLMDPSELPAEPPTTPYPYDDGAPAGDAPSGPGGIPATTGQAAEKPPA